MERRAQAAESLIARSSGQAALDHAIQAADLYMRAASEAPNKQDAIRLRRKCRQLLTSAETLKTAISVPLPLTPSQSLLQKVSRLHGNTFSPWTGEPRQDEFELKGGAVPFIDDAVLTLSPKQTATFNGWKRPQELFRSEPGAEVDSFMETRHDCDLVQDLTTDCSVVASLCAAMRILTGKQSVLSSMFYPFDRSNNVPKLSHSGKYILRMYFNGCSRRVVIDDRLPDSLTDRTLFVVDRENPSLIWPALLEKAYLKVRGGYDFPGSNSGTDLWVLTGWIPDQIFLQREDLEIDSMWKKIKTAHDMDNIVVTLGTGRISTEEEDFLGLIGEHDYAVMDLDIVEDSRRLLIKNPWCNGPVWKGSTYSQAGAEDLSSTMGGLTLASHNHTAGSFWMSLEDVIQHFESMYLNWNPALFTHRQDHHLAWHIPSAQTATSLVHNPQYSLHCPKGGSVWILASRHFMDAELDLARKKTDSMAAVSRQLGFMSILVFDNGGNRVQVNDGETYRGPYVDSPQTLARLDAAPGKRYTIVLDQHEFPFSDYTLTLSVFSHNPAEVEEAKDALSHAREITGTWNRRTAGGSAACSTFFRNPQYKLTVSRGGPITILLSTDRQDLHVHVDFIWGGGKRVDTVKVRDLVGSSGEYRRGCAIVNLPQVDAGEYTLVCSTFEAGQVADFGLRVSSATPVTLEPILGGAAGKLRTRLPVFKLLDGEEVRRAPLTTTFLNRLSINARIVAEHGLESWDRPSSTLTIRLSVVHGWAPERTTMAVSGDGEFQEPKTVVRTPEFDMEPGRVQHEGMWLMVESMGTQNANDGIEIELYSDSPVRVGSWEVI